MTTARYPDWFAALGQPIPDENRAHLRQLLASWGVLAAESLVAIVADAVEADDPALAIAALRSEDGLGHDESAVIRACAELCCPPLVADRG